MLMLIKTSLGKDGTVEVMNKSYSVVLETAGPIVTMTGMLEYSVMVK